jgi:PAS domain S-box-containing protein
MKKICEAEKYFEIFFDNAADGILLTSVKTKKIVVGNKALGEMLGSSKNSLKNKTISSVYSKEGLRVIKSEINKMPRKKVVLVENILVKRKNGEIFYADVNISLLTMPDGEKYSLSIFRDISARKKALCDSEDRFKNLAKLLPQAVFEMDGNGRLTFVNEHGLKSFGYTAADIKRGVNVAQMITPSDRKRALKTISVRLVKKNFGYSEYEALRKDGSTFPVVIYSDYMQVDSNSAGMRGVVVDISQVKKAELALRETVAKDEALLASIADGVVAVDSQGKIILINHAARIMLGWHKAEAMGKMWYEVLRKQDEKGNDIPPEKSAFYLALNAGKISTAISSYYYVRKDGNKFPIARAVSPVVIGGKIIGAINVFRDITTEKELDRAKNDFLSLASHQLRTPLSAMKWTLEMILKDFELEEKMKKYLQDIYYSNEHLIELVNGLMDAMRIESGKLTVNKTMVDMVRLIDLAYDKCKASAAKKGQQVKLFIDATVDEVEVDSTLFSETMNNILSNAIGFASEMSKITIRVGANKNSYVVSVHNSGSFIVEADRDKIFTKFFRGQNSINSQHIGSGLGLYLVKAAVEANGGKIWFKSDLKKGTTFYFTVPFSL